MALTQKNFGDPSYGARLNLSGTLAAGAAAQSVPKHVAHANLLAYALNAYQTAAGTSTYTATVNGTATTQVNGQQLSLIVITNTATSGAAVALATSTVGPFYSGGGFVAGGTNTGQVGGVNQFALNTTAGVAGQGGVPIPQGSMFYVVSGTDATAAAAVGIDVQIAVGAPLTI